MQMPFILGSLNNLTLVLSCNSVYFLVLCMYWLPMVTREGKEETQSAIKTIVRTIIVNIC